MYIIYIYIYPITFALTVNLNDYVNEYLVF